MHGISRSRSLVAAAIIMAMAASITGLFGASGPTVRITSPASGAQVSGVIQIRASVSGSAGTGYVIFGVDDTRPYSSNSMPYTFSLDTRGLSDGAHRVFAEVYDNYGLIASSNVVTIRVSNGLSSAVQARSEPATRVAERPAAPAPTRVAQRPTPTPPARVAANAEPATGASTATSTQESERAATSAPTVAVRGPLPEPTRTTAQPEVTPATVSGVDAPAYASLPAAPTSTRPPEARATVVAATATPLAERVRGHTVVLNGRAVQFGVAPFIRDGRLQCEFRTLFEHTGATVSWQSETRTAQSVTEGLRVEIPIGSRIARVNGQPVDLGTTAIIMEGRTIVPVRFFAGATNCAVGWDSRTQVASLQTQTRTIAGRVAE